MSGSSTKRDYYAILGVPAGASKRRIEIAYKNRAKSHHPDRGGEEEKMKSLNEAYAVLHDDTARRVYDAGRVVIPVQPTFVPATSPSATADAVYGQAAGAIVSIAIGLVLMLLVRFHWIWVLWPLGILAAFVILMGVFMAHNVLRIVREGFTRNHVIHRLRWIQEALFWSAVCAGTYGIYLLLKGF
jgi:hypothetical protein